jgi:hypothetical protein
LFFHHDFIVTALSGKGDGTGDDDIVDLLSDDDGSGDD